MRTGSHSVSILAWALAGALIGGLVWRPGRAAEPAWPDALQAVMTQERRAFDGELALFVKDLTTGERCTHQASAPVYLASGIKILVMIAVFEAVYQGRLDWSDPLPFSEEDVRDGAYELLPRHVGESFCVQDLVEWMMQKSDNAATDLLVKAVGIERVNGVAREYGGPSFGRITRLVDVRRHIYLQLDARAASLSNLQIASLALLRPLGERAKVFGELIGGPAGAFSLEQLLHAYRRYYESGLNSASLEDMARILERLERGEVVHPVASWDMLSLMRRCQTGAGRVLAGLPAQVSFAHKTGTQLKRMCDLGIIYLPGGRPIVFTACLKNYSSRQAAEALLARLARQTVALLAPGLDEPPQAPPPEADAPALVPIGTTP